MLRGRGPDLARMTITQKPAATAQPRRRLDRRPTPSGATSGEAVRGQTPTAQPVISHAVRPPIHPCLGINRDFCTCLIVPSPESVEPQLFVTFPNYSELQVHERDLVIAGCCS